MDVWDWIPVRDRPIVQGTIVSAGSPITGGFLWDHVKGRGPGAGGRANNTELKHDLKLSFGRCEAVGSQSSRTCCNWWSCRLDVV